MTKVTHKERRFTRAFVEECKAQSQLPESECDYAPTIEGVLPCPESRRPKKKRGQVPGFVQFDEVAYFAHSGEPVPQHTPSGRHVKPFNPPIHELPREPKRVTQNQLRGLNANAVHIDDEGFLKEGPKKVKGFDQLRDLFGKG